MSAEIEQSILLKLATRGRVEYDGDWPIYISAYLELTRDEAAYLESLKAAARLLEKDSDE